MAVQVHDRQCPAYLLPALTLAGQQSQCRCEWIQAGAQAERNSIIWEARKIREEAGDHSIEHGDGVVDGITQLLQRLGAE